MALKTSASKTGASVLRAGGSVLHPLKVKAAATTAANEIFMAVPPLPKELVNQR
jgi:hypothetical protein